MFAAPGGRIRARSDGRRRSGAGRFVRVSVDPTTSKPAAVSIDGSSAEGTEPVRPARISANHCAPARSSRSARPGGPPADHRAARASVPRARRSRGSDPLGSSRSWSKRSAAARRRCDAVDMTPRSDRPGSRASRPLGNSAGWVLIRGSESSLRRPMRRRGRHRRRAVDGDDIHVGEPAGELARFQRRDRSRCRGPTHQRRIRTRSSVTHVAVSVTKARRTSPSSWAWAAASSPVCRPCGHVRVQPWSRSSSRSRNGTGCPGTVEMAFRTRLDRGALAGHADVGGGNGYR